MRSSPSQPEQPQVPPSSTQVAGPNAEPPVAFTKDSSWTRPVRPATRPPPADPTPAAHRTQAPQLTPISTPQPVGQGTSIGDAVGSGAEAVGSGLYLVGAWFGGTVTSGVSVVAAIPATINIV